MENNKTTYTPAPWAHVPHQTENKAFVQSGDGRHLAELWTLDKTINCQANAERIVECVNAMKGVIDPKGFVHRARMLALKHNEQTETVADLKHQRNDLLEALKEARQEWAHWMRKVGATPADDKAFVRCAQLLDKLEWGTPNATQP